jgi:hypothetical protein
MTEHEYAEIIARQAKWKHTKPASEGAIPAQGAVKATAASHREVIESYQAPKANKPLLEDEEQAALIQWLILKGIRHHHSPNGGHRHIAVAKKLKAQGVSPGFPDLMIFPPAGSDLPILFVELKRTKGGTVSEEQKDWLAYLNQIMGTHKTAGAVCKGCKDAIRFIESWGY